MVKVARGASPMVDVGWQSMGFEGEVLDCVGAGVESILNRCRGGLNE